MLARLQSPIFAILIICLKRKAVMSDIAKIQNVESELYGQPKKCF